MGKMGGQLRGRVGMRTSECGEKAETVLGGGTSERGE